MLKKHATHFTLTITACFLTIALISCSPTTDHKMREQKSLSSKLDWGTFETDEALQFIKKCQTDFESSDTLFKKIDSRAIESEQLLIQLNELERIMDGALGLSSLYANVHPDKNVRDAAELCEQNFVKLISNISLSKPIYEQIQALELSDKEDVDKRYAEDMLRSYRRSGVDLDANNQNRVKKLNDEINQLGQAFYKNIRDDVRTLEIPIDSDLSGLPEDFIKERLNETSNIITLTTNYPDYLPVMQYAHNDELKRSMYTIYRGRGYPSNKEVLQSILEKRHELANILGYPTYAAYVTEVQMMGTAQRAQEFIDAINKTAKTKSNEEYNILLSRLKKIDPNATSVGDWQKTYLDELIKKENFNVDSQEVRKYFQYDKVKNGIFELTKNLFDVDIRPWQTETWDNTVSSYEVVDNGKVIGRFFLDMHPREGKYKHAAAFTIQDGMRDGQLPIKALVCNFPSGDELMEHSQVETFLHEFGHLLHGIFGGHQKWLSQSGIKTERDFVEAPSQMLEEWIWNAETLRSFATTKSGEVIPDTLIQKLKAGRDFGAGLFTRHQMFYAALSLNYYNQNPTDFDTHTLMKNLQSEYSNFSYVDDTYFQYSFGHLYGYSAAYYTYMWSLVIADDMFSEFDKQGLLNKETAKRYRKYVLDPGGSKDAEQLVEDFLGRPYTFDAFSKKFQ